MPGGVAEAVDLPFFESVGRNLLTLGVFKQAGILRVGILRRCSRLRTTARESGKLLWVVRLSNVWVAAEPCFTDVAALFRGILELLSFVGKGQ